jgi:hypothetical protein
MMSTLNRYEPCGLYLSPKHAAPSATNVVIRRFSSFEAGVKYLKTQVRADARHLYRLITESGAIFEGKDVRDPM